MLSEIEIGKYVCECALGKVFESSEVIPLLHTIAELQGEKKRAFQQGFEAGWHRSVDVRSRLPGLT